MDEQAFSSTLDAIYDAATAPDQWPVALGRLADVFGCSYAGLIERNLVTTEGRAIAAGVDLASQREYFEVWSTRDVLRRWTPAYRAGVVQTDRDILPRPDLLRSDYYNGFMKPRDMHAVLRITLAAGPGFRKIISMARPLSRGEFDASDVEQCMSFVPHLQRAASVSQRIEESNGWLASFSDVVEQNTAGVMLLDRDGCVVFANRAALTMANEADGFVLHRNRIEVAHRDCNAALQRLIAGATGRLDRTDAPRGGVQRLPRQSGKLDYAVAAAPLGRRSPIPDKAPVAFLLITDPDSGGHHASANIRELFGLSPAEVRMAERLMLGDSPEEAAAFLKVKISTARWHLSSLYTKTGTRRQTQLLRLLMSVSRV